jgi:hypothetical protein
MEINLTVDEETVEMLIRTGIIKTIEARPMKRRFQKILGELIRER